MQIHWKIIRTQAFRWFSPSAKYISLLGDYNSPVFPSDRGEKSREKRKGELAREREFAFPFDSFPFIKFITIQVTQYCTYIQIYIHLIIRYFSYRPNNSLLLVKNKEKLKDGKPPIGGNTSIPDYRP